MAEYQNPQHEPGSEKRLLLIFLATFVLMLLFQPLLKKYFPQQTSSEQQNQSAQKQPAAPVPAVATPLAPVISRSAASKKAEHETETVIENDLYRITFTNKGAQVKSWILKKYDNDAQNGPLDLVNPAAAAQFGYPLSLWMYQKDEALSATVNSALYVSSQTGKLTPPATLTFEYADDNVAVRKTFAVDHSYVVAIESSVTSKGSPVTALPAWPSGFGDQTTAAFYASGAIDYQNNNKIERTPVKKISGGGTVPGPFHWVGPSDQYFAAIFIPNEPASVSMVTLRNSLDVPRDPQKPDSKEVTKVDLVGAAVGNPNGPTVTRLFAGPKEVDVLAKISVPGVADNDLRGLVDFGFFGAIAKPLFQWLKWTYHHMIPNWGWAIVFQTLVITIALMPLRITQMKSMLKMQRIQPQIKAIQDKYKKYSLRDPRKAAMNEEISAIYKKEGVNPVGGCLPMLIQLPFWYAYYKMLAIAIDLRHSHWLWIRDLSAADPLYLLPILMVVSMLVTQRMTPQPGMDPAQQRMMTVMMPLMMGFIFFRLPAGLNLYYAESNLVSIVQQWVMNRTKLGREMREIMAKRARKKEK